MDAAAPHIVALWRDIAASYSRPGVVVRRQLAAGIGEERVLAYVMFASILTFIARVPDLVAAHNALGAGAPQFTTFIGSNIVASVIFAPLFLYGLAAVSHVIAKTIGGQGDWFAARLALFWCLLSLQPLVLIRAYMIAPYVSDNTKFFLSILIGVLFLAIWLRALRAVEWPVAPA